MEILVNVCLGLFCILIFCLICVFGWFWYQAYKLRNQAEEFIKNRAKNLAKDGTNLTISKFQKKLNEEIEKKNKK